MVSVKVEDTRLLEVERDVQEMVAITSNSVNDRSTFGTLFDKHQFIDKAKEERIRPRERNAREVTVSR